MDATGLPSALETVILNIRHAITRLRMDVIRNLYVDLKEIADEIDMDNTITDDVFESTLGEHGIFLSQSQMWQITRHFGDGEDNLNWVEIMDHIRGQTPSEAKSQFFEKLFNHIKPEDSENITITQILDRFDPTKHPKVAVGFISADRAFQEFANSFKGLPEILDLNIFIRVFQEMSIYFFDEEYLEVFFAGTFKLPELSPKEEMVFRLSETKRVVKEKLRTRQRGNESFQQTLIRLFKFFDINGDAMINLDEFRTTFERMGLILPDNMTRALFEGLDNNQDNQINYKEFVTGFFDE